MLYAMLTTYRRSGSRGVTNSKMQNFTVGKDSTRPLFGRDSTVQINEVFCQIRKSKSETTVGGGKMTAARTQRYRGSTVNSMQNSHTVTSCFTSEHPLPARAVLPHTSMFQLSLKQRMMYWLQQQWQNLLAI